MAQLITGNLFNAANAQSQIGQAKSYQTSSAMNTLNALKGVASVAQNISAVEFDKEMKVREEAAIEKAVTDGSIAVSSDMYAADLREGESAYDKAYNKSVQAGVASNISTLARTETARLAQQYKDDPDGFKGAEVGLFETIATENGLDTNAQNILFNEMKNEMSRYLPSIAASGYQKLKANQLAAQTKELDALQNVALNSMRSGDTSKYMDDRRQTLARLDLMKSEGQINDDQYNTAISSFDKEASSQLLVGGVERPLAKDNISGAIAERNAWEKDMRESNLMSPDEIDKELMRIDGMIGSAQKALKEATSNANIMADIWNSDEVLDYKDKGDKKAVNSFTNQTLGENPDYANPTNRQAVFTIAEKTGVVPESYISYVRKTQFSSDPAMVMDGVNTLDSLLATRPEFKDQFSSKDIAFADSVTSFVAAGMSPEEAVVNTKTTLTTDFQTLQTANIASIGDTKDFSTKVSKGVTNFLDDNLDRWTEFGETISDSQKTLLTKDYDTMYKYHLGKTANPDAAAKATERDLRNKYGVTYINGKREMTAYPVEQTSLGLPSDQVNEENPVTLQWEDDKQSIAKELGMGVSKEVVNQATGMTYSAVNPTKKEVKYDTSKITLQPTPVVAQGVPVYQVYIEDDMGITSPATTILEDGSITYKYWTYDSQTTQDKKEQEQQKTVEEAQVDHQKAIQRKDELTNFIKQTTQGTGTNMWGAMGQRRF